MGPFEARSAITPNQRELGVFRAVVLGVGEGRIWRTVNASLPG